MPGPPIDVGSVLAGRLRIERKIGSGAMGVVFEATDLKLGRRVAVKVLGEDGAPDPAYAQRMEREAKAAASLTSEHVTRVYDFGTLEDGTPFLVMELLAGRSLADRLESDGPMPVATAIGHLLAAIDAVGEAHGLGLVHRDLKPENLFLAERAGRPPIVKVLDFGIVKDLSADAPRITMTGVSVGTPAYMAPEQISGGAIDARTDVWALGVTLYELISGGPLPFDTSTIPGILSRIVREAPTPLTDHVKDVPAPVLAILDRCMAKPPSERFPTVLALGEALRACLPSDAAAKVVAPEVSGPTVEASPKPRTRWGLLVFTVFMTVVVALAGAYAAWRTSPARRGRHREAHAVGVADAGPAEPADASIAEAGLAMDASDAESEPLDAGASTATVEWDGGKPDLATLQGPLRITFQPESTSCVDASDAGTAFRAEIARLERSSAGSAVRRCFVETQFDPPAHFKPTYDVKVAAGKILAVSPFGSPAHQRLTECVKKALVGQALETGCDATFRLTLQGNCSCVMPTSTKRCVKNDCQ